MPLDNKHGLIFPHFWIPRGYREGLVEGPRIGLKGVVENVLVLNQDGSIAYETGPFENVITNGGLDRVCSAIVIASAFTHCRVGTGSATPAVTDVGLQAQVASTSTYLPGAGNCGTTRPNGWTLVMRRTYDFALGAVVGNMAELAFADSPTGQIFSRVLIQSGGVPTVVTVTASQQLRVVYTLTVTLAPNVHTPVDVTITGWGPTPGNHAIQNTASRHALAVVGESGSTDWPAMATSNEGNLEPRSVAEARAFISPSALALAAVGSSVSRSVAGSFNRPLTPVAYTAGLFFREVSLPVGLAQANATHFSCGLGEAFNHAYAYVFNDGRIKVNTHTLDLIFRITLARA